ncbi:MAG: alcohol dehydrogenase catalytic domain-containing protein [Myxococcaceae bacterium]|nr:alcohol dehydrogenase catalytic domain-containing protein [Myxococcaceae bacterium]
MSGFVAFTHPREAPVVSARAVPAPGPGEVLVRLEACGAGAADFGFFQLDALPRTPLIPGFEAVGVVEATGGGTGVAIGTRVGLTPLASVCGGCGLCERGLERWCPKAVLHGWHRDGFLAQHAVTTDRAVVPLGDGDDASQWAPLFASGWTAMGAVRAAGVGQGGRLGVIGVGGLGHLVVQVASAQGLAVAAWDVDADRRALAGEAACPEPFPMESVDALIVCTPSTQAIQQALRAVRRGGTLVLAAASPSVRFDLSLFDTVMRGVTLAPAFLGTRSDLTELISLARAGVVRPRVTRRRFADLPGAFWALRDGGFTGRLVFNP